MVDEHARPVGDQAVGDDWGDWVRERAQTKDASPLRSFSFDFLTVLWLPSCAAVCSRWQVCPHIFGGIPPSVVDKEFPMLRDGKAYLSILGLTEAPSKAQRK